MVEETIYSLSEFYISIFCFICIYVCTMCVYIYIADYDVICSHYSIGSLFWGQVYFCTVFFAILVSFPYTSYNPQTCLELVFGRDQKGLNGWEIRKRICKISKNVLIFTGILQNPSCSDIFKSLHMERTPGSELLQLSMLGDLPRLHWTL